MSEKIACSHCHLEFDESVMIKDGQYHFCCNGCQGVFHLLSDQGLDSFYDKAHNVKLTPVTNLYEDSQHFNAQSFYKKYVKTNKDGFHEVSLIIEGIHCSACVWLNEKALQKMDGVIEANINFTNNKATVVWVDDVVKLSQIIDMIRAIGYNAFAYDPSTQEITANAKRKDYYLRMAVAAFASMNIMMIAVAQYAGYFTGMIQDIKTNLNIAEWVLSTPVLFYSGWIFFRGAYYGMKNNIVNMDILVATGATLTYLYSIYITVQEIGEAYFDSVSMIITFVLIGKYLEVISKKSAVDALDIMGKDMPTEVKILQGEKTELCAIDNVKVDDIVIVSSGEKVLFDGQVIKGGGSFNESSLTGENQPVYKKFGDKIISGTSSIDADLHFRVAKDFAHSTLSSLISLLESALNKKPKIEQLANRLSEYFSTAILLLAFVTFLGWWMWPHSFEESFLVGISVIVIACPCALALATPLATLVGLSLGTSRGILFKEAAQLEIMAQADTIVFDKTGTLTLGKLEVVHEKLLREFDKNILYSLIQGSNHPISIGIREYLNQQKYYEYPFEEYKQIPARGISALYEGKQIFGGNIQLLEENGYKFSYESDNSLFCIAIDGEVVAVYELCDTIKEYAKELVKTFQKKNIDVVMLTGDNKVVATNVAKELGIKNYLYQQTPQSKLEYIGELQANNKHVIMVGDGVNDILAMASADIGIAMGSGSDVAIDVGDVVLLDDSLHSLEDALKIAQTTYNLVKQNLAISLLYNVITIPLAMAGYIIPLIAAISMSASSLLVVGNSMRIRLNWKKS